MKTKGERIDALKLLISTSEMSNQEELLQALRKRGFNITQATLSRDLKRLKVSKAPTMDGGYVYLLPNDAMYKRLGQSHPEQGALLSTGARTLLFSGNMAVLKTRTGYASAIAFNIDNSGIEEIIGTIAGGDTVFMVIREGADLTELRYALHRLLPDLLEE